MPQLIETIASVLEIFLNLLELVTLIVAVTTFFFLMINKYSKALQKILGPNGLGPFLRLRVLFLCRKSQIKKRAFIEYAILQTGGDLVSRAEWLAIINGFKAFYVESEQGSLCYTLANCTPLIESDFSTATARYFAYFSRPDVKKTFGIQEESFPWVIRIRIEEAYATPTCLLTGLLSQYNESWEEFIKRYVSTAYITENGEVANANVLSNELYFTFAWLLWGPSYELDYRNYWAGLCQLSFGDESNSVPAVADTDTDVAESLRRRFLANDERRYGALISADVLLYDKKPFYAALRDTINPNNAYFYEKVEGGELSFGLRIESFQPSLNYKAKKYYSTAYVWLLFELEDGGFAFKPEKSVAFFEHANLASKVTYLFLVETLIDKSLRHFRDIFEEEKTRERHYRFICALNDRIEQACAARFAAVSADGTPFGEWLSTHVSFLRKHEPATVFAAYDEFFSPSNQLCYVEVKKEDKSSITDFGQFYTDVYNEAFPDENERETFDNFLHYIGRDEPADGAYVYHVLLAKDESGRVVGGAVFDYFKKSNAGVVEFLAVRQDLQSGGIGTELYRHIVATLSADAFRTVDKPLDYIFCEIDSPEYSRAEIKKYLYFWDKNHYRHLSFSYLQPALSAGQAPVTGLWLTVSPQHTVSDGVPTRAVVDVVHDYIKYAMDIEPEQCAEYLTMREELSHRETVALSSLLEGGN